jgi:hypothetical protein
MVLMKKPDSTISINTEKKEEVAKANVLGLPVARGTSLQPSSNDISEDVLEKYLTQVRSPAGKYAPRAF